MKEKKIAIAENLFFGIIIVACFVLTFIFHLSALTLVTCITSIVYIVFLSERNILNFIVGFASSSTYIVVAYQSMLFGEALFYLVVDIPLIFISFFMWRKHMETKFKVKTKKLSIKNIVFLALISVVLTFAYGFVLKSIGDINPFIDALSTVATFIATLLMMTRFREQWAIWIIVYAISIVLWATTFDLLMLIMSAACLISSISGLVKWSSSSKRNEQKITQQI